MVLENSSNEPPELPPRPVSMATVANEYCTDSTIVLRSCASSSIRKCPDTSETPPPLPPRDSTAPVKLPLNDSDNTIKEAEQLDCWVNCTRFEASKLLLSGERKGGTYLLRPCHSRRERYAISILRDEDHYAVSSESNPRSSLAGLLIRLRSRFNHQRVRHRPVSVSELETSNKVGIQANRVKHYLIRESPAGFYLYSNRRFKDIADLVAYYSTSPAKHRGPGALLRCSIAVDETADSISGEGKNDKTSVVRDSRGRRVRLVKKIGDGSYEMFLAEANGARVVSVILTDKLPARRSGNSTKKKSNERSTTELYDSKQSTKTAQLEDDPIGEYSGYVATASRRHSARAMIRGGALLLQEAIGRAADRLVAERPVKDAAKAADV